MRAAVRKIYPLCVLVTAALLLTTVPARATETLSFIHTDVAGSDLPRDLRTVQKLRAAPEKVWQILKQKGVAK